MSWRDREYNRSDYKGGSTGQAVFNLFFGSVYIGSLFGIRIRIHATFFWFVAITLLAGSGRDNLYVMRYRAISMAALFLMVLVHGLKSGTDSQSPWALALYWGSGASVLLGSVHRVVAVRRGRAKEALRATGLVAVGGRARALPESGS